MSLGEFFYINYFYLFNEFDLGVKYFYYWLISDYLLSVVI